MKRLILILVIAVSVAGCKKSTPTPTSGTVTIAIKGSGYTIDATLTTASGITSYPFGSKIASSIDHVFTVDGNTGDKIAIDLKNYAGNPVSAEVTYLGHNLGSYNCTDQTCEWTPLITLK